MQIFEESLDWRESNFKEVSQKERKTVQIYRLMEVELMNIIYLIIKQTCLKKGFPISVRVLLESCKFKVVFSWEVFLQQTFSRRDQRELTS